MAKKEMKDTRKRSLGTKKKKGPITKTIILVTMKKKGVTKNLNMMKENPTRNTVKPQRRRRKENTVTRNSTRRDQKPLVITRRPTKMNTTKNTNSMMTKKKKANIR